MNVADFRRIALSLEGVEEGSHLGGEPQGSHPKVSGEVYATIGCIATRYIVNGSFFEENRGPRGPPDDSI